MKFHAGVLRDPLVPIHSRVNSEQTRPSVERSFLEACSDMALNKGEQASDFDSSSRSLRPVCSLLSPVGFLTPQRSTSDFAGGDQHHFRWNERI